jgi:adenylate kinase
MKHHRIIITGRPGSGKGTQAKLLAEVLDIPHISTGDIFRDHMARKTELGLQITESMNAGKYTADSITNQVIKERLAENDAKHGFILDGYPRTLAQVEFMVSEDLVVDLVVNIDVPEQVCIERLLKRGKDSKRGDDDEKVILNRMGLYTETVVPVVERYQNERLLKSFDGNQEKGLIHQQIVRYCN